MEDMKVLVLDASTWYDATDKKALLEAAGYEGTKYPMRWWFPEETYKDRPEQPQPGLRPLALGQSDRNDLTQRRQRQARLKDFVGQMHGRVRHRSATP